MTKQLTTDEQFEHACLSHSTVYVKDKHGEMNGFIGSVEAFNPVFVTVSGQQLMRDDFEFKVKE
jgi:hypothetical protein